MFNDLRFAARRLARSPGFSVTVILLLGLALGANACVFSVLYGLLYKPLPFAQDQTLVTIDTRFTSMNLDFNLGLSVPYLEQIAGNAKTISQVAAYHDKTIDMRDDSADGGGSLRVARIQPALFGTLGTQPALGRLLAEDDSGEASMPTAMISWDLWQNRYAGAANVAEKNLRLDGKSYRIVGVLPRGFVFLRGEPQVWIPIIFSAADRSVQQAGNFSDLYAVARLARAGTTIDATGEIGTIAQNTDGLKEILGVTGFSAKVKPLRSIWVEQRQSALDLMLLAVALVMLVTAANVCNLYIARLLTRQHEAALLEALGAGSRRLLQQVVGETLLLASAATLVGLAVLPAALALLGRFDLVPKDSPQHIGIDAATIAFIVALALAVAAAMTLAAMALRRRDVHEAIKQGGTRQTSGRSAQRARQALIVGQIALTAILLVGTGLLLHSSRLLLNEGVGFDRDHLLMAALNFKIDGNADEATKEHGRADVRSIVERARALPGVNVVGVGSMAPFGINDGASNFLPPGAADVEQKLQPTARSVFVSRDYFAALGLALTQGRPFSADETANGAAVVIVDADFVQRYGAGRDLIGQSFKIGVQDQDQMRQVTIVGIAAQVKQRTLDEHAERPTIYLPMETPLDPMLLVRSSIDPAAIAAPLKQIIHDVAPQAKAIETFSMREWIARTVRDRQRLNSLLQLLGAMALALASVGLYAVLAYTVRARTLEFGVRMALGADRRRILAGVLGQGAALVALGLVLGLAAAYWLTNLLGSRLYHVGAFDPLTVLTVVLLLGAIGLAACWWPARSAARVDPIVALRHE